MSEASVNQVFEILNASQKQEYIGEPISQLEHALQCAHFARNCGGDNEVIVACLLHDIGHLCVPADSPQMDGLGVLDHEGLGGEFLRQLGFSDLVVDLVKNHVSGKRYLCSKFPSYYKQLSDASRGTLEFQGGVMSREEAA